MLKQKTKKAFSGFALLASIMSIFFSYAVFAANEIVNYGGINCTPKRLSADRLYYSLNGGLFNNDLDSSVVVRCPVPTTQWVGFPLKVSVKFRNTTPGQEIVCFFRTHTVSGNKITSQSKKIRLDAYSDNWVNRTFPTLPNFGHASMTCEIPRDNSLTPASGVASYTVLNQTPLPY